jgi:hypothetical protein
LVQTLSPSCIIRPCFDLISNDKDTSLYPKGSGKNYQIRTR